MKEEVIIPYDLPEKDNHSFFFIDQRVDLRLEAKLHRHDAWELHYVVKGKGTRTIGDTMLSFVEGDAVLLPPSIHHHWDFDPAYADADGCIRYLMVAFEHKFVDHCMAVFPELRNRMSGIDFPSSAVKYGAESSLAIRRSLFAMTGQDELGRLCEMIRLLPVIFDASDCTFAGSPMSIERDVRRMQQVSAYVMAHYIHHISLDAIATEVGMNRSAFCSWFKRCKGTTFSQFVMHYRLKTACELLESSAKSVSEISYLVGFSDVAYFVRVFTKTKGVSPGRYRKAECGDKRVADD